MDISNARGGGTGEEVYRRAYLCVTLETLNGMPYRYCVLHDHLPPNDNLITFYEDIDDAVECVDALILYDKRDGSLF